jgi:hypothetical protein
MPEFLKQPFRDSFSLSKDLPDIKDPGGSPKSSAVKGPLDIPVARR